MKFETTKIVENPDGSADYSFDWDDEFEAYYCEIFGIEKITKEHFQRCVLESLQFMKDQIQSPED